MSSSAKGKFDDPKFYTAGSARVAMRQLGVVTYLFVDQLSSTSVAFDDAANTIRRQGYTAFGAERYSQGGDLPTRYQYTGQRGFEEVGLYYYGARWYDNYLNRFLSPDSSFVGWVERCTKPLLRITNSKPS